MPETLSHTLVFALVVLSAFSVGLSVNRGSTCAVAAARDLVRHRRLGTSIGFVLAIAIAGVLTISSRWAFGPAIHLAGHPVIGWPLLFGGVLLGFGASLNGACMFGTLGRIGNGELRFMGMPIGLAIGFAAMATFPVMTLPTPRLSPLVQPSLAGALLLLAFVAVGMASWRHLGRDAALGRVTTDYRMAMLVLGAAGAAGFMLMPGSSYADAVRLTVLGAMMGYAMPIVSTIAALAGTIWAGYRAGRLRVRWPRMYPFARSVGGGALMAMGSSLIPGGNDALLLAYLPGAAVGGLLAYAVMTATVIALQWGLRRPM